MYVFVARSFFFLAAGLVVRATAFDRRAGLGPAALRGVAVTRGAAMAGAAASVAVAASFDVASRFGGALEPSVSERAVSARASSRVLGSASAAASFGVSARAMRSSA